MTPSHTLIALSLISLVGLLHEVALGGGCRWLRLLDLVVRHMLKSSISSASYFSSLITDSLYAT